MRLVSTPEGVRNREVSALALIETLLAMSVSVFIAVEFGTLKHIAVSACIAPFLLLQTDQSRQIAIRWCAQTSKAVFASYFPNKILEKDSKDIGILSGIIIMPLTLYIVLVFFGFAFFFIRTTAVFLSLFRSPLVALGSVPKNWKTAILCTDIAHLPEVVPGMELEEIPKELRAFRFKKFTTLIFLRKNILSIFMRMVFLYFPIFVLLYLPAMMYRWSLKSTALIWSPLLWVFSPATDDLVARLQEICKAAFYRVMRYYSFVVGLLFLTKLYVLWSWHELMTAWSLWPNLAEAWATVPQADIFNAYIVPPEIPWWQLAAFVNAVLAWAAYFIADLLLVRYKNHQSLPRDWLNDAFRWVAIIRNTLSFYTIACTLYITVELALEGRWDLPPLGAKLFPWL